MRGLFIAAAFIFPTMAHAACEAQLHGVDVQFQSLKSLVSLADVPPPDIRRYLDSEMEAGLNQGNNARMDLVTKNEWYSSHNLRTQLDKVQESYNRFKAQDSPKDKAIAGVTFLDDIHILRQQFDDYWNSPYGARVRTFPNEKKDATWIQLTFAKSSVSLATRCLISGLK